ncbi:DeoR/GlpR family DNA-binding transcription regulator [Saccharopolyspora sp. K220]|uniref:DeoR/GlpR family DNA-binding transcription regulator n=1 Tax=Saccharopolyspora soli TaxID=2926618 RepID=UPI001F58FFDC|nr:DeoR/GlpR family DNA-binding transcription regulator [Saccharopolyspora soli]MCI2421606.1 DeoR/GlpR family DNA-binding transcription regulator [Saccharopolyspora soli]
MGSVRPSDAVVEQRRREVLRHVIEHGGARIDELAERFEVSLMTMHRDLDELAERRLLRKLRGRVESYPSLTVETATRFRIGLHVAEKAALASAAARAVRPGTTVLLDDSSTIFPLAREVSEIEELTLVTNSVSVAQILSGAGREVVLLGGRYRSEFDSCTGPDVLRALSRLRVDISFTSATAIANGRLFHPIQDYADVKEGILESTERNVLLVDHSKFGKTATFSYGDVRAYDLVITDEATPEHELAAIRDLGTEVRVVPVRS